MRETRSEIDSICSAIILICIFWGLFGCFYSIFGILKIASFLYTNAMIFIPFAVLCSFLFFSEKLTRIGVPIMIIFLVILAGIFRVELLFYVRTIYSFVVLRFNQYYSVHLKILEDTDNVNLLLFQRGNLIFILFAIFLLSIDIAGLLRSERIFLLSILLFILGMLIGKIPSASNIFLLLTGLFGLLSMRSKDQDFQEKWKLGKKSEIKIDCITQQEAKETFLHSGQKAAIFTTICFLLALFLGNFFEMKFGESFMKYHAAIQSWANNLEYTLLHYDYYNLFKNLSSSSRKNGSSGKLSNAKIYYTGKEVLRITVNEKPEEAMYFRGFVGKDYQGYRWTDIDEMAFSEKMQTWFTGNKEELAIEIGNITYNKLKYHLFTPLTIKTEYINAPGTYAYLPYFSKLPSLVTPNADGIITRKEIRNRKLPNILYAKGFIGNNSYSYFYSNNEHEINIQENNLETEYTDYVYEQYLNVPDTIPRLEKSCKNHNNSNINSITKFINKYLKNHADYSLDLEPLPFGEDFTEYFLYTQKKGYCIHFATAAVLMYRLCNIPARFVEGYVAWPEDFKENKDGTYTASIPDSRAHAWAEIYYDNIGFMPIDMTPVTESTEENGEMAVANTRENSTMKEVAEGETSTEKTEDKENNHIENEIDDNAKDFEEDSNGTKTQAKDFDITALAESDTTCVFWNSLRILLVHLKVPCLILLAVFTIFSVNMTWSIIYHRWKYKQQVQKMLDGIDNKKRQEIIWISCRLHEYLKLSGYERKWKKFCGEQISDQDYENMIKKEFVFLKEKDYHRFCQIVQKALYSSPVAKNVISDGEISECNAFLKLIRDYLSEQMPGYKRILFKGVIF